MNARRAPSEGKITTFYSFKGGVGRTMSVANVAFLAALNGLRVLVMDWDLEAPGLAYYFRGLPEADEARGIKTAPGVLDLVWAWRERLAEAASATAVDAILDEYSAGTPFHRCVRPVLQAENLPKGAALDILGAGARQITDELTYAEALARFSWTDFFDAFAGGLFLERLRAWARSNYDVILIDSRTGYADVAGVCTIQLPDVVALTFIYNRQNIEGVASVAESIHRERGDAVRVRAVPMRISREGTLPEADARSRAIRYLHRSGAFTEEAAKADMERLAIRASPSMPFYETLAPFATPTPTADQLTLDYKRLAEAICGHPIRRVEVTEEWRDRVGRRLEPKTATADYVADLASADPARAMEEIDRLLDGALEAELHEEGLERDYIIALIDFALDLNDLMLDEVPDAEVREIAAKAVRLAASEFEIDPPSWAMVYASARQQYDESWDYAIDSAGRNQRLAAYDKILEEGGSTDQILLRRAQIRSDLADLARPTDADLAIAEIQHARTLLDRVRDPELRTEVDERRAMLCYSEALALQSAMDLPGSKAAAEAGLELVTRHARAKRPQLIRIGTELQFLLAKLEPNPEAAAHHLMEVIRNDSFVTVLYGDLPTAVEILLRSENRASYAIELIRRLTPTTQHRGIHMPTFVYGRSAPLTRMFLRASLRLLELLAASEDEQALRAAGDLLRVNTTLVDALLRRLEAGSVVRATGRDLAKLQADASALAQTGVLAGASSEAARELLRVVDRLEAYVASSGIKK